MQKCIHPLAAPGPPSCVEHPGENHSCLEPATASTHTDPSATQNTSK